MNEEVNAGLTLPLLWDLFSKHKHQGRGDQKISHNDLENADTNYAVGTGIRTTTEGSGVESVSCGFRPGLVIILAGSDDSDLNNNTYWSAGVATPNDGGKIIYQAESLDGYLKMYAGSGMIYVCKPNNNPNVTASFNAFNDTGFSLNFSTVDKDCVYLYIAFK